MIPMSTKALLFAFEIVEFRTERTEREEEKRKNDNVEGERETVQ